MGGNRSALTGTGTVAACANKATGVLRIVGTGQKWVLAGTTSSPDQSRQWKIQGYAICAVVQG